MVACYRPRLLVTVSGPSRVSMKVIGALNDCAARSTAASQNRSEKRCRAECREQFCPPAEGEVFSLDIPFYRTGDQSDNRYFADVLLTAMCRMCAPSGTLLGRAH